MLTADYYCHDKQRLSAVCWLWFCVNTVVANADSAWLTACKYVKIKVLGISYHLCILPPCDTVENISHFIGMFATRSFGDCYVLVDVVQRTHSRRRHCYGLSRGRSIVCGTLVSALECICLNMRRLVSLRVWGRWQDKMLHATLVKTDNFLLNRNKNKS